MKMVDPPALLETPSRCHLFSGATGPLRIIGQAKKYNDTVNVGEVRDFITTFDNIRKRHPDVEPHVPAWFRSARCPVAGWFIAHEGFQSGAGRLARDHGIVTADSLDLAEIAALSRKIDLLIQPEGRSQEIVVMINKVLENFGD